MSDINHNRMIPLHIADQAVAACEDEIQRLREENANLKAALRKEVMAIVRDEIAKAKACEAENARLKAEVERLREAGDRMKAALNGTYNHELPCVEEWNAAKEDKPSV